MRIASGELNRLLRFDPVYVAATVITPALIMQTQLDSSAVVSLVLELTCSFGPGVSLEVFGGGAGTAGQEKGNKY